MRINKNSQKAPNLRFKGFIDDWEQRKLGELASITTGKLDANAMVEGGAYDFYTSGIKKYSIDKAAFEGPAITIAGNGATVGYMHLADGKFNAYQRTYVLTKLSSDRLFTFYEISNKLPKKIQQEARTGNIPYIVMDMLTELKLSIPNSREQNYIGSFIKSLDNTITLHQRKLDQLKQLKEALLQQMFPGKGETVPKLRFVGFEGDWEERKLGSIYDFSKGKGLPLNSFTYSKDDPAIAYGHLYTKYSEVISEVYLSSDDDGVLSKENDLLFPGSSTVPNGTAQANAIMLNNVKLGGDIIIARPKQDIRVLSIFMSYQINSQRQKLFPITVGTTIAHMYGKDLSKVKFFITNYSEQEKIGSLLEKLDNKIIFQQRKLEQIQNIKQVLLENMFI